MTLNERATEVAVQLLADYRERGGGEADRV